MNIKKILEKLNGTKITMVILIIVILALCITTGIDRAIMSGEGQRTSDAITAAKPSLQSDWQADDQDFYNTYIKEDLEGAISMANLAKSTADNITSVFENFYKTEYTVYTGNHAYTDSFLWDWLTSHGNRITNLENLSQVTSPVLDAYTISGMTICAGQTVMVGEVRLVISNPLSVPFPNNEFLFLLEGDNNFIGNLDITITYDPLYHFSLLAADSHYIAFVTGLMDVSAHTTITIDITFHVVFDYPVENDITFTPYLYLY